MIKELLPSQVACVETTGDHAVSLFPEELAAVAGAVEKRRREFGTARWCARAALHSLGLPPTPIVPGPRGAPSWPPAIVGSITHCAGFRAAAVAHQRDLVTLGIDAEPNEPLPHGVFEAISLPEERAQQRRFGAFGSVCWDRLLFSIKESVYKAWYPITHRFLDFDGAIVRIDPERGTFHAELRTPPAHVDGTRIAAFSGRWAATDSLLISAIAVPNGCAVPIVQRTACGSEHSKGG